MCVIMVLMILGTLSACNKKNDEKGKSSKELNIQPTIVLNGEENITVSAGDIYADEGAKATDGNNNDISSKIISVITKDNAEVPQVDTEVEGIYLIKYSVKDDKDNVSKEIIRKVEVTKANDEVDPNTAYVSSGTVNIRDKVGKEGKKVAIIPKGSKLTIIKEVTEPNGTVWLNVKFKDNLEEKSGWIKKENTSDKKVSMIYEAYKNLDFSPIEKKTYPNNPRVKVKGVYLTIYSAGTKRLDTLIEMTKRTEINAFVIDVKDDDGNLLFPMKAGEKYAPKANNKNYVKDIAPFMKKLKDNNIYTIARIVSFKDPIYTEANPNKAIVFKDSGKPFTNSDNLRWATAYDKNLWEYNIAVAKEAAAAGFNEIQFDYVRFPASDGGKLDKILDYRNVDNETKPQAIQNYLKYARKELSPLGVYISADIYGLVSLVQDDMGLGQYWEAVSNVVDYVSPMMYPSHYANGVYGLSVPDAFPYETVYNSTRDAIWRNKNIKIPGVIRPWIQDFSATWVKGHISYGKTQVEDQIRALKNNGVDEYLLWNAFNKYSEIQGEVKQ